MTIEREKEREAEEQRKERNDMKKTEHPTTLVSNLVTAR